MSDLPEPVQRLYTAIEHLPGVRTVELSIQPLEGVDVSMLRLPGEFADLPIAVGFLVQNSEIETLSEVVK